VGGPSVGSSTSSSNPSGSKRKGEFHDEADAEWIVIRGLLRGHNDTPFGRPTRGWPIGCLGVGHPQGVFGVFSYYWLVMLFLMMDLMVRLTVALAKRNLQIWRPMDGLRHELVDAAGQTVPPGGWLFRWGVQQQSPNRTGGLHDQADSECISIRKAIRPSMLYCYMPCG
jgi:hypothetical protein